MAHPIGISLAPQAFSLCQPWRLPPFPLHSSQPEPGTEGLAGPMGRWGTGPGNPHPLLCQERQSVERPRNSEAQNPALQAGRRRKRERPAAPDLIQTSASPGTVMAGVGLRPLSDMSLCLRPAPLQA